MSALRKGSLGIGVCLAGLLLAALLFGDLGHPLLWNDEADTAVFGERVLRHGRPVVTGEPSLAYHVRPEHIRPDGVYTAGVWGQYYVAAAAVWLAGERDDLYRHTARLRLVFAGTGLAAIGLLAWGLAPLAGPRPRRLVFALGLLLAACVSTSLLLHLREVRYYAPSVLLSSGICVLYARRQLRCSLGPVAWLAGASVALGALFCFFPPAFGTLWVCLLVAISWRVVRPGTSGRLRAWLVEASPLLVSGALALAVFVSLDLLEQAQFVADTSSRRSFGENLRFILQGLVRYELLAPAIAAHLGVTWLSRARPDATGPAAARRGFTRFVLLFVAVHSVLIAMLPLAWERYLIVLSLPISAALVLDATALFAAWRLGDDATRPRARLACLALGLALLASLGVRAPEIRGRIREIASPVTGPLDAIIPYLRERFDDPAGLVIATNYEGPAYTYYLKSHVIVGYYGQNLAADLEQRPDLIIPRPWPPQLRALAELRRRDRFRIVELPVRQQRTNNVPMLWRNSPGRVVHRFENEAPASREQAVLLLERER